MIEHITWKDAVSTDPWTHADDIDSRFHMIETCGFIIKDDESVLIIGLNHDLDSNNWSCFITIPKEMIVSRTKVIWR